MAEIRKEDLLSGLFYAASNDRLYPSGDMSKLFNGLILDGIYLSSRDGDPYNKQFKTVALETPAMKIKVAPGRAWFNGTFTILDSETVFNIDSAGSSTRIDALVIETNTQDRENSIHVVKGDSNEKPEMVHGGGIDQYPIAYITVRANTTAIEDHDINYVVGIETPYFAWLGESLNISENYSKWETELGRITEPFNPWLDSMERMLGYGDQDYSKIKQELAAVSEDPIANGLYPKVDELIEEETGDGATTVYDLSSLNINVLADILIDNRLVYDYTYENNAVTFKEAPANGSVIKFCYVPNNNLNKYTLYFGEV